MQQKEPQTAPQTTLLGQQPLFMQQATSAFTAIHPDDSHFPPLMPSLSPWLLQQVDHSHTV